MEPVQEWSVLSGYVRFYQWLGFQPYRLENGTMNRFFAHTVIQFGAVVVNLSLIVYRRYCILYHCETIGMVVDFIKLLTILLANMTLYVELFHTIPNVCRCWKTLHKAHERLKSHGMVDHRQLNRLIRYYWILMIGTFVYLLAVELYCYYEAAEQQTKRFYVYFFIPQYLLHLKEQQILYPTIVLIFYLRTAHTALEYHVELLRHSVRLRSTPYLEFLASEMSFLKLVHNDLYRASTEMNEAFGKTYLIIYCKNYIQIISNSYWVVFWVLNQQPDHAIRISSRLVIRIILLSVMFYVNSMAMEASDRFRYRLNAIELGIQIKNRTLFVMIESLIKQCNLERIRLTAGDCFALNCKPIVTIVFTVCAYTSIFIQQALKANCHELEETEC